MNIMKAKLWIRLLRIEVNFIWDPRIHVFLKMQLILFELVYVNSYYLYKLFDEKFIPELFGCPITPFGTAVSVSQYYLAL